MKMKYWIRAALFTGILLLAGCDHSNVTPQPVHDGKSYLVLAEQLRAPWSIDFDQSAIYITEREGNIVKLEGGKLSRHPVQLLKAVNAQGEGGLLGFVLAPDFTETRQAYAYHTYESNGSILNRVIVLREKDGHWSEVRTLLDHIPGSFNHDGGRLAIGPDHHLYITTGDAGQEELAQELHSLAGKILRMSLDGSIPKDNPYADSYVYSYGHRNSQGIAWDQNHVLYATEHGPSGSPRGHDEINRIEPGSNYGWPLVIGNETQKGLTPPIYHSGDISIAPSGAAFDADNRLLIATLRGETLYRFKPESGTIESLLEGEGRLRDVKVHQGNTYVLTNNTDGRGNPSAVDDRLLLLNKD